MKKNAHHTTQIRNFSLTVQVNSTNYKISYKKVKATPDLLDAGLV